MTNQNGKTEPKCQCSVVYKALAISANELAKLLDVSVRQIWRLNGAGKLPKPNRIGGCVRWNRQEIEDWFSKGCPDRRSWEARKEVQG